MSELTVATRAPQFIKRKLDQVIAKVESSQDKNSKIRLSPLTYEEVTNKALQASLVKPPAGKYSHNEYKFQTHELLLDAITYEQFYQMLGVHGHIAFCKGFSKPREMHHKGLNKTFLTYLVCFYFDYPVFFLIGLEVSEKKHIIFTVNDGQNECHVLKMVANVKYYLSTSTK